MLVSITNLRQHSLSMCNLSVIILAESGNILSFRFLFNINPKKAIYIFVIPSHVFDGEFRQLGRALQFRIQQLVSYF